MKKSFVTLFVLILAACNYAQSPSQLRLRCPSPNSSIFQYFSLRSDGNQNAVPCPGGSFLINGLPVPTGSGTTNKVAYWNSGSTLAASTVDFISTASAFNTTTNGSLALFNNVSNSPAGYNEQYIGNENNYVSFFGEPTYNGNWLYAASPNLARTAILSLNASNIAGSANNYFSLQLPSDGQAKFTVGDYLFQNSTNNSEFNMAFTPSTTVGRFQIGDFTTTPTNYLDLNQATNKFSIGATTFDIFAGTSASYARFATSGLYSFSNNAASNFVNFDVVGKLFDVNFSTGGGSANFSVPTGQVGLGDPKGSGNGTRIVVSDATPAITLTANNGQIVFANSFTPGAAADACTQGKVAWDANYIYICTASGAWKRAAIATW